MMDYEFFKAAVEEKFMDYLPEKYQGMKLQIIPTEKVNQTMDALMFSMEGDGTRVSPTVYINRMYESYRNGMSFEAVMRQAAELMDRNFARIAPRLNMDEAMNNIVFGLVNTAQNEHMLQHMPHREFQDLSIIYRWMLDTGESEVMNAVVNDALAGTLGVTEEELFAAASKNTQRLLPPEVITMGQVMREIMTGEKLPEGMAEELMDGVNEEQDMWIISNNMRINGASSVLYEGVLHELAEKVGSDLYILPSSVHEVIAVPAKAGMEPDELRDMVEQINMTTVDLQDRLSNEVYYYDKDLRELTRTATDMPYRSIADKAAEEVIPYAAKSR